MQPRVYCAGTAGERDRQKSVVTCSASNSREQCGRSPFVRGCLFGLGLVVFLACFAGSQPVGAKVLDSKCTACHAKLVVCAKLGRDGAYWQKTVARMAGKQGADIGHEEQDAVSAYLAGLAPGAAQVCD